MIARLLMFAHRFLTWHVQDLDERPDDIKGHRAPAALFPLEGRANFWRRVADHVLVDERRQRLLRIEWALKRRDSFGASFAIDDDDDGTVTASVQTPVGAVYLSVPMPEIVAAWVGRGHDRVLSWRVNDGALWWSLWCDKWGNAHPRPPRWRYGSWHFVDALLGEPVFSERVIRTSDVELPLPEGPYPAHATLSECTWQRARWPFPLRVMTCNVDAPGGVPSDHKGPTFGISGPASTIANGVGKFVSSILRSRSPNNPAGWKWVGDLERQACINRAAEPRRGKGAAPHG